MRRRPPTGFMQHCLWAVVSALLWLGPARQVHAEAVDLAVQSDEPAAYRERIDEGLREFSVQNYEEARSLFLQAHALMPSARTLRALGLCEYELRNYGESVKYLEGALGSKVKPLNATLRGETERMIARARNFVGRVVVELRPTTAELLVDGVKVESPADEPLWLAMGEHTLEVTAPGFVGEKRKLSVKGGEDKTLSFLLASGEGEANDERSSERTKGASARPWYKSPWLWTSVGVVLAGAAAGTAVALTREDSGPRRDGGSTGTFVPVR